MQSTSPTQAVQTGQYWRIEEMLKDAQTNQCWGSDYVRAFQEAYRSQPLMLAPFLRHAPLSSMDIADGLVYGIEHSCSDAVEIISAFALEKLKITEIAAVLRWAGDNSWHDRCVALIVQVEKEMIEATRKGDAQRAGAIAELFAQYGSRCAQYAHGAPSVSGRISQQLKDLQDQEKKRMETVQKEDAKIVHTIAAICHRYGSCCAHHARDEQSVLGAARRGDTEALQQLVVSMADWQKAYGQTGTDVGAQQALIQALRVRFNKAKDDGDLETLQEIFAHAGRFLSKTDVESIEFVSDEVAAVLNEFAEYRQKDACDSSASLPAVASFSLSLIAEESLIV